MGALGRSREGRRKSEQFGGDRAAGFAWTQQVALGDRGGGFGAGGN